jgi:hypothetical protein
VCVDNAGAVEARDWKEDDEDEHGDYNVEGGNGNAVSVKFHGENDH